MTVITTTLLIIILLGDIAEMVKPMVVKNNAST